MVARKYGVVYTPDRLADFAAELLCSEIEESKFDNIKVLDPACGECALLDSVKKIKGTPPFVFVAKGQKVDYAVDQRNYDGKYVN